MPASKKPTHLPPLTDADRAYVKPTDTKAWQGGRRFVTNRRGGLYKTRSGNSHGGLKAKTSKAGPATKKPVYERPTKRPHWARKYEG